MDKLHISEAGESFIIKRRYYYERCCPASQQKGSLSLWMICKTREELLLILQLYYRLNWMKSRIRLALM